MCSSGCTNPGSHKTYGECMRSKNMQFSSIEAHRYDRAMHKGLDNYVECLKDGMEPASTFPADVAYARKITDLTGVPYRADI